MLPRNPWADWSVWEQADRSRRELGALLDALGLGPVETPSRVVLTRPGLTLKAYGEDGDTGDARPVILLVPAPIKRAYIWDLAPGVSAVRQCLDQDLRVYLIQWERPGADEQGFGLADYADRLILDCLQTIEGERGRRRVFLAGHSLGGTLAAIFAALNPELVEGLVLLGAPVRFGSDAGAIDRLVAVSPPAPLLTSLLGNVPGSYLDLASVLAAPTTFVAERWLDWLASLPDADARLTHLRVERWTLDESPLARRLFEEVTELLYRQDRFMRGTLQVAGRRATPELVETPLLSVVDPRCAVVPPAAILPFHEAVRSAERRVLRYGGDAGVALQHVGMLVGQGAHRELWPEILRWVHAQGD